MCKHCSAYLFFGSALFKKNLYSIHKVKLIKLDLNFVMTNNAENLYKKEIK